MALAGLITGYLGLLISAAMISVLLFAVGEHASELQQSMEEARQSMESEPVEPTSR